MIARPQKPVGNVFFHSGDHRSPLRYHWKVYDKSQCTSFLTYEKGRPGGRPLRLVILLNDDALAGGSGGVGFVGVDVHSERELFAYADNGVAVYN